MNWYWRRLGGHVHVRVFMNGAHCGNLCFRVGEFHELQKRFLLDLEKPSRDFVVFVEEPAGEVPCAEAKETIYK